MPGLVRPKDVVARLKNLDERTLCEMYARLLPRAMANNPMKEWRITTNPTRDDVAEVVGVLPPSDMSDIEDIWFW